MKRAADKQQPSLSHGSKNEDMQPKCRRMNTKAGKEAKDQRVSVAVPSTNNALQRSNIQTGCNTNPPNSTSHSDKSTPSPNFYSPSVNPAIPTLPVYAAQAMATSSAFHRHLFASENYLPLRRVEDTQLPFSRFSGWRQLLSNWPLVNPSSSYPSLPMPSNDLLHHLNMFQWINNRLFSTNQAIRMPNEGSSALKMAQNPTTQNNVKLSMQSSMSVLRTPAPRQQSPLTLQERNKRSCQSLAFSPCAFAARYQATPQRPAVYQSFPPHQSSFQEKRVASQPFRCSCNELQKSSNVDGCGRTIERVSKPFPQMKDVTNFPNANHLCSRKSNCDGGRTPCTENALQNAARNIWKTKTTSPKQSDEGITKENYPKQVLATGFNHLREKQLATSGHNQIDLPLGGSDNSRSSPAGVQHRSLTMQPKQSVSCDKSQRLDFISSSVSLPSGDPTSSNSFTPSQVLFQNDMFTKTNPRPAASSSPGKALDLRKSNPPPNETVCFQATKNYPKKSNQESSCQSQQTQNEGEHYTYSKGHGSCLGDYEAEFGQDYIVSKIFEKCAEEGRWILIEAYTRLCILLPEKIMTSNCSEELRSHLEKFRRFLRDGDVGNALGEQHQILYVMFKSERSPQKRLQLVAFLLHDILLINAVEWLYDVTITVLQRCNDIRNGITNLKGEIEGTALQRCKAACYFVACYLNFSASRMNDCRTEGDNACTVISQGAFEVREKDTMLLAVKELLHRCFRHRGNFIEARKFQASVNTLKVNLGIKGTFLPATLRKAMKDTKMKTACAE